MSKCKLGDILRIQHGYAFKSENYVDSSEYRLITLGNFADGNSFKYNDEKATYYGSDFPSEFILKEDDLIMPMTEQVEGLFGNTAFIPKTTNYTFVLNQRVGKVVYNKNKVDKYYLHYLLATNSVKKQLEARASGTRQRNISPENIYDIEVDIPDIEIQEKIGRILYSLEEKQINNNKINAELESIAKTIYDYWFLQFEFPNEEGKPYKSSGGKMVWNEELKREIPERWECKKLDEVFDFVKGKIPDKLFEKKDDELIEYLTIEAVNSGTIKYCSKESMVTTTGEVLMVMDGAASSDVYVGNIGVIGSTFCKLEIKNNYVDNNFLFLIMKKLEPIFKKVNTGSTVPHANKNYINNFKICLPKDDKLRFKLQQSIVSCINKIVKNKQQNQELISLQDFLLPLLMNGQVGFREVALAE